MDYFNSKLHDLCNIDICTKITYAVKVIHRKGAPMKLSFRMKMFLLFSALVGVLLLGLMSVFYVYNSSQLTQYAFSGMQQSALLIRQNLDSMVEQMDNTSLVILYSRDLQEILYHSLAEDRSDVNYFDVHADQRVKVQDILISALGVKTNPRRVSVFNGERNYVFLATSPTVTNLNPTNADAYRYTQSLKNPEVYSVLTGPHKDFWMNATNAPVVISLIRRIEYGNGGFAPIGYLEIQQPYSMVADVCASAARSGARVYIRDADGRQIYPLSPANTGSAYFLEAARSKNADHFTCNTPGTKGGELVYKTTSSVSRWTILYVMPQRALFSSVRWFQTLMLLTALLLLALSLGVVFLGTRSLTAPVRKMRRQMETVTAEMPFLNLDLKENDELVLLQSAFNHTIRQLASSYRQVAELRAREYESRYRALRFQMNPHFLYNSLMAISAVAMESGDDTVVGMCGALSGMMRYVTSSQLDVTLQEDLRYASDFLAMMKYRYEENLIYAVRVEGEPETVRVPRLMIQPLLENAFAHGFRNKKPPCRLTVAAQAGEDWTVSVTDNGAGFSAEALTKLRDQMLEYARHAQEPVENNMTIGGMALLNIYIRLHLFCGKKVVFRVERTENGGACVTVGSKSAGGSLYLDGVDITGLPEGGTDDV